MTTAFLYLQLLVAQNYCQNISNTYQDCVKRVYICLSSGESREPKMECFK